MRDALDGVESLGGAETVRTHVAGFAFDLLLDSRDANLEKFIEIRAEDGEEFYALEQWLGGVLRFLENAAIEFEPAQLAIDEVRRIREIAFRFGLIRCGKFQTRFVLGLCGWGGESVRVHTYSARLRYPRIVTRGARERCTRCGESGRHPERSRGTP